MIFVCLALVALNVALGYHTVRLYSRMLRLVAAIEVAPETVLDVLAPANPTARREREPQPTATPIGL